MLTLSELTEEAGHVSRVAHRSRRVHLEQQGVFIAVDEDGAHIEATS
ncbi:unnamed protein product, partial [marine sediment metagenome]